MMKNFDRLNDLFDELVPCTGKADSLAGEMVRATARIGYRFYNDGDRIGIGYGKETCNPAARFLIQKAPKEIADLTAALYGMASEDGYEAVLEILAAKLADYIAFRNTPTSRMPAPRWTFSGSRTAQSCTAASP